MAVFLNRNKRPLAAPIEVAELLSEKPPPPQNLPQNRLFGREREGGGFSTEKPPPSQSLHRHRLCQISGLVYVAAAADGHVVGKELNRNDSEKRRKLVGHGWEQP